ncbi:hypothetical protein SELMODRAFT_57044, partial [Selaginella moellendorffii]
SESFVKGPLRYIAADRKSRKIAFFLAMNATFMVVEFVSGFMSNSLGLVSDACHMLFDCAALGIGLYASYISKLQPNAVFGYGYGRFEVLSGYANAVLLVLVGSLIVLESIERILDPPEISTEKLLLVSVGGLLVNLVGLHDHHHHHHHHHIDHNMRGIFLHVLADTLGSVGVVISTVLIQYKGWMLTDPACSIFISAMIIVSAVPLLTNSAEILLQRTPRSVEKRLHEALERIRHVEGVAGFERMHVWSCTNSEIVGSLHLHAYTADKNGVRDKVARLLNKAGITDLTVQVESI